MLHKPNHVFDSNKRFAAADFLRHWKLVFLRLLWFILITILLGYTLYLPFKKTEPYLTLDIHLLSQILRLEIEETMGNKDAEQGSGNDDERTKRKAEKISEISQGLLSKLSASWYFVCIAHSGNLLATAPASASHLCDKDTIKKHVDFSDNQQKNYHVVQARKSGNREIPSTLHFVKDGYGTGFHLWVVKRLQPEQVDPTYSLVKDNFVHVVLILGVIVLSTYALGHFVRQENRSKSDSGEERVA